MTEKPDTKSVVVCEEEISLSRSSGSLPIYSAFPNDNKAHPGIILIHEIFGVNEHIRDLARRFARQSYTVYAPDLFAYSPKLPEDRNNLQAMRAVWADIHDDQLIGDLQAVFSSIHNSTRVQGKPVGTIGYCMGGAIAFMFACRTPLIKWIADYYGRIYYQEITDKKPRHPISYTGGLNCPLLGLFAGVDELIPAEHIFDFQKKLAELGKTYKVKTYPTAKHAFFNDQREFYHYEAAVDAWQLTLAYIEENSKEKS